MNSAVMEVSSWDRYAAAITSSHFGDAQQRVLRQMIEALMFENILVYTTHPQPDSIVRFVIAARDSANLPVRYECEGVVSASFGRIRLRNTPLLRVEHGLKYPVSSISQFLWEAGGLIETDPARLSCFIGEIHQTLLKDALALSARLATTADDNLTALEGILQEGHPYHPCYKSRIGFDPVDNFYYGPEFLPSVRLVWLAIKRSRAKLATCRSLEFDTFMQAELEPQQYQAMVAKLQHLGLVPQEYLFMPAHPWQWREKIATELFTLFHTRDLVWLGAGEDNYRPLQSIRSLANHSHARKCQIKLPISIVNTSADRILSCHHVENAPMVSDWLCEIAARDPVLQQSGLVFLKELAGITFQDDSLPATLTAQQYGMLGAVWRESVEIHLREGEQATPFSGLCQCEPDGKPFVAPWIEHHGLLPWLDALFHATAVPLLHLLYAHGIGMEAHGQNIVLLHRQGMPCRIALKDLPGGLRFMRNYLRAPLDCPSFIPTPSFRKSANAATMEENNSSALRDYFCDAVFFINFAQLAFVLGQHYSLDENQFWERLAAHIHCYQAHHPEYAARFEEIDVFSARINVEQLAKRRLFPETHARLQEVSNPLHRYRKPSMRQAA